MRATLGPDSGQRLASDAAVVAAAEVVAAGIGRSHPELPDGVAAWVERRRERPWAQLVPVALAAVDQLITAGDDEDQADRDVAAYELEDLHRRLAAVAGGA